MHSRCKWRVNLKRGVLTVVFLSFFIIEAREDDQIGLSDWLLCADYTANIIFQNKHFGVANRYGRSAAIGMR